MAADIETSRSMQPITIRYPFRPRRRSLASNRVADLFGLAAEEPPHIVAEDVTLGVRPGDVVLFSPAGTSFTERTLPLAANHAANALPRETNFPTRHPAGRPSRSQDRTRLMRDGGQRPARVDA